MATTIKIKRGLKQDLPTLAIGEFGYCTDTNELFIGLSGGNELVNVDTNTDTNSFVDGLTFNSSNGNLTVSRNDGLADLVVNLDGRYLQTFTDTNDFADSVTFDTNDGVLTIGRTGSLADLTVDLDGRYLNVDLKGAPDGLAELDSNGHVPASQLPAFVDDVINGYFNDNDNLFYEEDTFDTEISGASDKIYVDLTTNKTYRFNGSIFIIISETLALGETSSTAYRGDRGKDAYDHSLIQSGNPHNVTLEELGYEEPDPYVHPSYDGDDIDVDTNPLTGASVISDLDFNITTDTLGHVTDANATVATRNLTLNDLGYTEPGDGEITIEGTSGLTGQGVFTTNQDSNQTIPISADIATTQEAEDGATDAKLMTPLKTNEAIGGHRVEQYPHTFTDNGTTYKWGIAMQDGQLGIIYEEVIE